MCRRGLCVCVCVFLCALVCSCVGVVWNYHASLTAFVCWPAPDLGRHVCPHHPCAWGRSAPSIGGCDVRRARHSYVPCVRCRPRTRAPQHVPHAEATTKCKSLPDTVNGVVLLALVWNASAASVMGPFARKIWYAVLSGVRVLHGWPPVLTTPASRACHVSEYFHAASSACPSSCPCHVSWSCAAASSWKATWCRRHGVNCAALRPSIR